MKRFIFFTVIICAAWTVSAQIDVDLAGISEAENFRLNVRNLNSIKSFEDLEKHFEGSVLLFDKWTPGTVTMKNGSTEERTMNYYVFDNSLVYLNDDNSTSMLVMTDAISNVKIGNKLFEKGVYTDDKKTIAESGVMEVVLKGDPMSILKRYDMELIPGQDGSGYKESTRPAIKTKEKLYYKAADTNLAHPVPSRKKEFYAIFGDKAKQVEEYAKKNRLKTNDTGIAKMAEYYNSLSK